MAASEATQNSLRLRKVTGALGEDDSAVRIMEDNQACLAMASNPSSSNKTKHVDVRYHLVRDCVARGEVSLEYVSTVDVLADGMTKPLAATKFLLFRAGLGVVDIGAPCRRAGE